MGSGSFGAFEKPKAGTFGLLQHGRKHTCNNRITHPPRNGAGSDARKPKHSRRHHGGLADGRRLWQVVPRPGLWVRNNGSVTHIRVDDSHQRSAQRQARALTTLQRVRCTSGTMEGGFLPNSWSPPCPRSTTTHSTRHRDCTTGAATNDCNESASADSGSRRHTVLRAHDRTQGRWHSPTRAQRGRCRSGGYCQRFVRTGTCAAECVRRSSDPASWTQRSPSCRSGHVLVTRRR